MRLDGYRCDRCKEDCEREDFRNRGWVRIVTFGEPVDSKPVLTMDLCEPCYSHVERTIHTPPARAAT